MSNIDQDLSSKLKDLTLLALDFDGVFTDGTVYVNQEGVEAVQCSRRDGLGINLLQKHKIKVHVISKETNPIVSVRCKKMGIACDQSIHDGDGKLEILERIMRDLKLSPSNVAFMGDDLNDVPALKSANVAFTVADAHPAVKEIADYITEAPGGKHAVREVAELILQAKGIQLTKF